MRGAARIGEVANQVWARAACSHPALAGVSRAYFGELLDDLVPKWAAAHESALRARRGGDRRRTAGAGPKRRLVFVDRLLVTLVHLRLGLPHAALAELFGADRSTVSGSIREVRPLLVARPQQQDHPTRGVGTPNRPPRHVPLPGHRPARHDADSSRFPLDGDHP
ncbi:transposase family protein [Streptomyces sp. RG80]|uniref:helix-turn-helix domain-containing protein n=1 Tax=Streptomyces sp. RG80 TaxID=3157340 RepID=UPI00338F6922